MTLAFAISWDYRCPFARNAHEHVMTGLESGEPWEVTFVPFSLTQVHVAEGELDAWDDPAKANTLLAMQAGIVVRDRMPDKFLDAHRGLFSARHDDGRDLRDTAVINDVLGTAGIDPTAVATEIAAGWPLATFRKEHTEAAELHQVWGVPTVIAGGQAAFVRYMHRPEGDADVARHTIERTLELLTGWPDLNEFKHTSVPR